MGYCYLLHFEQPISPKHSCQHYLGYTKQTVDTRLADHLAGNGARLTQIALARNITFSCVRIWPNMTRNDERKLKNAKNSPRLCPICNAKLAI